jgi:hypothetical protein
MDADNLVFILDVLSIFNVVTAWGNSLSPKCIGNDLSVEHNPAIKRFLNDLIALSAALRL